MVAVALVTGLFIGIFVGIYGMGIMESMVPEVIWIGIGVVVGWVISPLKKQPNSTNSTALVKKE